MNWSHKLAIAKNFKAVSSISPLGYECVYMQKMELYFCWEHVPIIKSNYHVILLPLLQITDTHKN